MAPRHRLLHALTLAPLAGCAPDAEVLPPYGEVVVVVDTDAPVPAFAARLRVDVFDDDGTWLESRDVARLNPADWPASFSLYTTDEAHARTVLVRLRAYPDGKVRDYQGERFLPRPEGLAPDAPAPTAAPSDGPRLEREGIDATPLDEPTPALAIDRLVEIQLRPGQVRWAEVFLAGSCLGTMTDLLGRQTCVDTENVRVPVSRAHTAGAAPQATSKAGSFPPGTECVAAPRPAGTAADGSPLYDEEACVPGGVFVMGTEALVGVNTLGDEYDPVPERAAVIPPLLVDRYEVTVGRYRAARKAGFVPAIEPAANEDPITPTSTGLGLCSWSKNPHPGGQDREGFPLTCIPWDVARAFCQWAGGDLLTEAQWEWVATAAARDVETPFPWGAAQPTCESVLYGRYKFDDVCFDSGFGPASVADFPFDTTPVLGVVGLGGNASEWVRDRFLSMRTACWASASLLDPRCTDDAIVPLRSTRGSGWQQSALLLPGAARFGQPQGALSDMVYPSVGMRCARPGGAE